MKRFILIMSQKSAEGVLLQKSGGRPERKGVASKSRDLRSDQRQKSQPCLAFRTPGGVKLRGTSTKGPNRYLATRSIESPAIHK
jgi:hypothetical protein